MAIRSASTELVPEAVPANLCAKMVDTAARTCEPTQTIIQMPPEPANGAADALASLSTAFTFGSILLAIIALIAGFAWGKIVAAAAEKEARQAAKDCAEEYIAKWMANEAPSIIRKQVDLLNDATIGEGDDAEAADEIGKGA